MAQPAGIEQWNPAWITAAVAVLALIRPELTALYRRRFQPGSVEPVETGLIEVSYGSIGPTVAVLGTLHAWQRDYLIRRIDLTVTRERDKATHLFDWLAFRGRGMAITDDGTSRMEFPTTISVAQQQPARYHILFADRQFQDEFLQRVQKLKQEWFDYWKSKSITKPDGTITYADIGSTFDQFYADGRLPPYYNWFEQNFPWQPGMYTLAMRIVTIRPERHYSKSWRFELTEEDISNLRGNTYKILREACGMTNLPWSYALAKYLPNERTSATWPANKG